MYQFLDEHGMWSLDKKNSKNNIFLNRSSEHIVGYMIQLNKIKPNEKAKQHKTGVNQMEFQNVYVL
jgi:hypothetical protein